MWDRAAKNEFLRHSAAIREVFLKEKKVTIQNDFVASRTAPQITKGYKGMGMDGFLAGWYAKNTRKSMEQYKEWAKRFAEHAPEDSRVLELAPGPGYLAIELSKLGNYAITGLDISKTFVEIAEKNAKEAGVEIDFRHGDAACMPFDETTFDSIICTSAFKNFKEPVSALREMHRVLKPGGKALIVDLRHDLSSQSIDSFVDDMGLRWIDSLATRLIFKFMLKKRAYTVDQLKRFVSQTDFAEFEIVKNRISLEVWLKKGS